MEQEYGGETVIGQHRGLLDRTGEVLWRPDKGGPLSRVTKVLLGHTTEGALVYGRAKSFRDLVEHMGSAKAEVAPQLHVRGDLSGSLGRVRGDLLGQGLRCLPSWFFTDWSIFLSYWRQCRTVIFYLYMYTYIVPPRVGLFIKNEWKIIRITIEINQTNHKQFKLHLSYKNEGHE